MTVVSTAQYCPFLSSDKNAFSITYYKRGWEINAVRCDSKCGLQFN